MVQNVFATSATAENCSRHDLLAFVNNCLQANFTRIEEMSTGAAYCQLTDFLFRGMIQLRKVKWNSRNEVDWISNWRLLQTAWKEIGVEKANFTRIEEMSTGAAYCQLTDFLFRGMIQLRKVKWNSRNEVDWISNWRLLQTAWKEIGVEKAVPVERLLKGKFQDNFEFLQWFKKFFDANCTALPYDPIEARNGEVSMLNMIVIPGEYSCSEGQIPLPASVSTGSTRSATARTTTSMNAKKVAPGNGVQSSTRLTAVRGKPIVGSAAKSIAASANSLEIERQRCKELQAQLEEMTNAISAIEKERNFYFSKLQRVEAYCQNAGEDASVQCEAILHILYEIEEGFAIPIVDERSEQNGTDSVAIAAADGTQIKSDGEGFAIPIVDERNEQNGTDSVAIAAADRTQIKSDGVSIIDAGINALQIDDSETF
uniref:Calponin-homology (CH) domain-containing protein n=1 Tax=Ascaris lumbricoides TaxID=6252 RepID=A0A0M3ICJ8_ASCLU